MAWLKRFLLMIGFFTRIPMPLNLKVSAADFGKGLAFAPAIGLIIGWVLSVSCYIFKTVFPIHVTAVLTIIVYVLLTGGLHLDGLGDTFDGLFSGRSKEIVLEIMKDSRVGTNAVLAIVCVLLLDAVFLAEIWHKGMFAAMLLMPVAGRTGCLIGAGFSKYARAEESLGKSFIDHCTPMEAAAGFVMHILIFFLFMGGIGVLFSVIAAITGFIITKLLGRKIGGVTGDILGAVCELNQAVFLIIAYLWGYIYA